jgi:hypothetical protein
MRCTHTALFPASTDRPLALRVRVPFLQQRCGKRRRNGLSGHFFVAEYSIFTEALFILRIPNAVDETEWGNLKEVTMVKALIATIVTLGLIGAAAAADIPRRQPPPPVAPVGKAPVGKYPVGKTPVGKAPAPVVTRG